jgi:uncharacterized membrane protein (DUF106 family)
MTKQKALCLLGQAIYLLLPVLAVFLFCLTILVIGICAGIGQG